MYLWSVRYEIIRCKNRNEVGAAATAKPTSEADRGRHAGKRYLAMANRWLRPEHLFFGSILLLMLVGVAFQLTGFAPRAGFWMAVIAFGVAWLPAFLALVLFAISEWCRRGKAR